MYCGPTQSAIACKNPLHGTGAPHRAPPSVRTFTFTANIQQNQVPSYLVVCRQHTKPTTIPPLTLTTDPQLPSSYYKHVLINMSSNFNLPSTYKHAILRVRPASAHAVDHYNPRSRIAGHPLTPFITAPQPPQAYQDLVTTLESSPGRGLHTPLILADPHMGHAADLSTRTVDSYLLTCHYSTSPPQLASFWLHGVFLPESTMQSDALLYACSIARRWLLESLNHIDDLTARA
jgi:hypothetical protein